MKLTILLHRLWHLLNRECTNVYEFVRLDGSKGFSTCQREWRHPMDGGHHFRWTKHGWEVWT